MNIAQPSNLFGIWTALLLAALTEPGLAIDASKALKVDVVRGAGSNNNAATGAYIAPIVRVTDPDGRPVAGALVVFLPPVSGPTVRFGTVDQGAQGLTDAAGIVAAPPARPAYSNGAVRITVVASKDGAYGRATIYQMNLGVRSAQPPRNSLEIEVVDNELNLTRKGSVQIRVLDGAGQPVVGAIVRVVLVKNGLTPSGQNELAKGSTQADGHLEVALKHKLRHDGEAYLVQARAGDISASRYLVLPSPKSSAY